MSDAKIVPLRDGDVVRSDTEREMIDYAVVRIRKHIEDYGEPPTTMAIVTQSAKGRTGHSFSLNPDDQDRLGTCAAAAAILWERAIR
jgi:hypothetical protein